MIADQHRADLEESGKRDGRCGFSIVPPSWCQDGRIHQVRVYVLNARPEFLISETSVRFAKQAVAPLPWPSRAFFHLPQEPGSQMQSARALPGLNRLFFAIWNRLNALAPCTDEANHTFSENIEQLFDESDMACDVKAGDDLRILRTRATEILERVRVSDFK